MLSSCSDDKMYVNIGKRVDNDMISSIRNDIEDMKDPIIAEEGDVFWTPSGTIWHIYSDCTFIAKSKNILHGTPEEAKTAGMEKECSRCTERLELENFTQRELQEGDVFWTPMGTTQHIYSDCTFIINSKTILYGTPDEAKTAGMEKECSRCAQREALEKLSQKELQPGDVFWTWTGGVWHTKRDCRYIVNSTEVFFGSVEEAQNAEKSHACSACGK